MKWTSLQKRLVKLLQIFYRIGSIRGLYYKTLRTHNLRIP